MGAEPPVRVRLHALGICRAAAFGRQLGQVGIGLTLQPSDVGGPSPGNVFRVLLGDVGSDAPAGNAEQKPTDDDGHQCLPAGGRRHRDSVPSDSTSKVPRIRNSTPHYGD